MMELRSLSEAGRDRFAEYLEELRNGSSKEVPLSELNVDPYSSRFAVSGQVDEERTFATRLEMAEYLDGVLTGIDRNALLVDAGIWDWLTVLWFDVVCSRTQGQRRVRENARYIVSSDRTDYYRHLIRCTWELHSLHGRHSRIFLASHPYILNDWTEQLASRQDIVSNRGMIEAIDTLYWDNTRQQPKTGATDRKRAGNLRRLITVLAQLDLTYDLHAMSAADITALLPREFDVWRR